MRVWMLLVAIGLALPAEASRTLAVLPLEPGSNSEEYDGLGRALAGMLVSDLARVESLELVERARLDALLSEVELGKSGYVDPKTAVQLGKGVGAEWVVVGSWSVVGDAFLMDARTVDVQSGKIVTAVDANGEIADFITVQKTLVEELLAGLEVAVSAGERRKIIGAAQTEDFQAMTTYAAGLQAEFEGDYAEAKKRFEAAAKRDPQFSAPLERLGEVRSRLAELEATRLENRADEKTRRMLAALEKTPEEMKIKGRTEDPATIGKLSIRWALLEELDRQCQVVDEIRHYLERHKQGVTPSEGPEAFNHRHWAMYDLGLYDERPEIWDHGSVMAPRNRYSYLADHAPSPSYIPGLVIGITDGLDRADQLGRSLLNLTVACAGESPAARAESLTELQRFVLGLGLGELPMSNRSKRPVWTELEVALIEALASRDGMSLEVEQRTASLLELDTGVEGDAYQIRADVNRVVQIADRTERWKMLSDGMDEAQLLQVRDAVAAADASKIRVAEPACQQLMRGIVRYGERLEELKQSRNRSSAYWAKIDFGSAVTGLKLAGCIVGTPAELGTRAEALAWIDTMPSRARKDPTEDCEKALAEVPESTKNYRQSNPATDGLYQALTITMGLRLVRMGCADLR